MSDTFRYPIDKYSIESNVKYDGEKKFFFVQITLKCSLIRDKQLHNIFLEFIVPSETIISLANGINDIQNHGFREANHEERLSIGAVIPQAELKIMVDKVSKKFYVYFKLIGFHVPNNSVSQEDVIDFSIPVNILNTMASQITTLEGENFNEVDCNFDRVK